LADCAPRGLLFDDTDASMRWIYLVVIILFAAATIFALQNFKIVTMSFLGRAARAVGRHRLPSRRDDRRQPVRAAASIVRRVERNMMGSS
jgi:hypothetical protein